MVVATGYDAVPRLPEWAAGANDFEGELIHAGAFRSPAAYRGRDVLIVGAGNTGIDIAGHLGVLRDDGLPIHYDATEHPAAPRL